MFDSVIWTGGWGNNILESQAFKDARTDKERSVAMLDIYLGFGLIV